MNVNKLADEVEMWGRDLLALNMKGGIPVIEGAKMLRHQQAEIEALKMGFANSGTHDSELAETRAKAGRLFLKVNEQQVEIEALKEGIIKIKEGCSSVKTDDACIREVKELATLIIRDCNLTLQKVEK